MKKKNLLTYSIVLAFAIFTACSSDEIDTEAPRIVVNAPEDHAHFHPGDVILFNADFSDNVALKQFKIDIHYGGDHGHKSVSDDDHGHKWSYEHIGDLSGREQNVQMNITIPEDTHEGEYHFLVFATDEAGNEAQVVLEIEIEDDHHDH